MIDTDSDNPRRQAYEIVNESELSLSEKQRRILEIGRSVLDVENGHIERFDPNSQTNTIVASVGGEADFLATGTILDRATTYCRRTIERRSPLALSNASQQGWESDPAYEKHGLECYLGTTIFTDGEPYGTICFISRDVRETAFDADEKAFVELLGRLIGREIEATQHRRTIDEHRRERERSEGKFESLLTAAPDAIVLADAETAQLQEINDATTELTGYDRAELLDMNVFDLHPAENRAQYRAQFDHFLDHSDTVDRFADGSPLYIRTSDGRDVPVELSADRIELADRQYMMGIIRDISERKARECDLELKNRAIETASVGITIADATTDDLPLTYVNEAFERITGYSTEDALGRNCRFLQGPETATEPVEAIRTALATEEPITTDLLNYRADGTPFWNELTLTPVTDATGETTHFVGFQRDITSRKRREQVIKVLNRVLRHNLRNDLNAVLGYTESVADRVDDELASQLHRVREITTHLVDLSEKAHTIEQTIRNPGRYQARNVVTMVEEVRSELEEAYPTASITIEGPDERTITTTAQFSDALYELGENAIVHNDDSPAITFRIGDGDRDDRVTIAVEDNGPGLPDHERDVLKKGRETVLEHGSGIGLWLVNWMTTRIGGNVSTTVDGDGTTVTLSLPASDGCQHRDAGIDRPSALMAGSEPGTGFSSGSSSGR
ncbi:MAG: PAS domain S-box protein [Halobacteriales archaeon]